MSKSPLQQRRQMRHERRLQRRTGSENLLFAAAQSTQRARLLINSFTRARAGERRLKGRCALFEAFRSCGEVLRAWAQRRHLRQGRDRLTAEGRQDDGGTTAERRRIVKA